MQVPAPFEYARATSVEDAIGLLDRLGETARLVAGGQSLLPMMKLRLTNVEYLIDLNDLTWELGAITFEPDEVRVGALVRHSELLVHDRLAEVLPIIRDAERLIADWPVRNRGTLGGALCQADPSEDLSAVCATLDASCVIRGPHGERVVSMDDFYLGPYETAVGPAEILVEVRFPLRPGGSSAYEKVDRRSGDWAIASAGAAVWMEGPVIADARVGLAAVGPRTVALPEISALLRGEEPGEELFADAGRLAAVGCAPVTDQRGSAEFKRHLAGELTVRALRRAVARTGDRVAAGAAGGR
jgi:carbon-monoxide dehydrogenase medium subunit